MTEPAPATTTRRRSGVRRALWVGLCIIIGGYAGLCGLMYVLQGRLLYHPTRAMAGTPAQLGLAYEDVALIAEDGVRLAAWYVPADEPRGTVLFCHGNAGNMSHRLSTIEVWHDVGLNILVYDYRGYGPSDGRPDEAGTYRDAEAAWQHLARQRGVAAAGLVVHGRSLGGAVAAWVAERHPPKALILESTFTSVPDAAADLFPWLPARWLARYEYDTLARLPNVACPVLVIHSRADNLLPYAHGQALFESARAPKQFLEIHGPHGTGFMQSEAVYARGLTDFVAPYLAARPNGGQANRQGPRAP